MSYLVEEPFPFGTQEDLESVFSSPSSEKESLSSSSSSAEKESAIRSDAAYERYVRRLRLLAEASRPKGPFNTESQATIRSKEALLQYQQTYSGDCEYEFVKTVSDSRLMKFRGHNVYHINFLARPKVKNPDQEDEEKLFFVEAKVPIPFKNGAKYQYKVFNLADSHGAPLLNLTCCGESEPKIYHPHDGGYHCGIRPGEITRLCYGGAFTESDSDSDDTSLSHM